MSMKQVYYPYWQWEDFLNGMWRKEIRQNEDKLLKEAIEFTGDHDLYGSYMMKVVIEWPISAEQNLTDKNINQKAWVGHAACCLYSKLPEYIVRKAWGFLTENQKMLANYQAEKAIKFWKSKYIYKDVENEQPSFL